MSFSCDFVQESSRPNSNGWGDAGAGYQLQLLSTWQLRPAELEWLVVLVLDTARCTQQQPVHSLYLQSPSRSDELSELERFVVLVLDTAASYCWDAAGASGQQFAVLFDLRGALGRRPWQSTLQRHRGRGVGGC